MSESNTQPQQEQPEPKRFQCRHILTNGLQCRAVCLRGEDFCYFHHTTRRPLANPSESDARREAVAKGSARRATFSLPLIEDRASIQLAIAQILCRIAQNEIDPRRAGLLLYGLQIASLNLPKLPVPPGDSEHSDPELTVEEVILHPDHGPIAPQQDFELHLGSSHKSLEQILMEDWAREEAREAARLQQQDSAEPFTLDSLQGTATPGAPSSTDGLTVGQGGVLGHKTPVPHLRRASSRLSRGPRRTKLSAGVETWASPEATALPSQSPASPLRYRESGRKAISAPSQQKRAQPKAAPAPYILKT